MIFSLFLWTGVVVICWTDITDLCVPFVPYSLWSFGFRSFGRSCPSGSRKIQHSAPPRACQELSRTILVDSLCRWSVPYFLMDSLSGWCFERLDLRGSPGADGFSSAFVGQFEIACTKSSLCFSFSPSLVLRQRVLVCKATSVYELYVGADPEIQLWYCTSAATAFSGGSSFGSCRGFWVMGLDFVSQPLLCSACRYMSTCLSPAVPTSWRRNRGLCVSLLLCPCLFLPARLVSSLSLDLRVVVLLLDRHHCPV